MFDFSFGEVGLIAVVALVVLGPERLPKVARTAGALMRRARNSWQSVKDEIERELEAEELKRSLAEARQAADALRSDLRNAGGDVSTAAQDLHRDLHAATTPTQALPAGAGVDPAGPPAVAPAPAPAATPGAAPVLASPTSDAHAARAPEPATSPPAASP